MPENIDTVVEQTAYTFDEDRVVIEDQYRNIADFGDRNSWMDIHVDAGANWARRHRERLLADVRPEEVAGRSDRDAQGPVTPGAKKPGTSRASSWSADGGRCPPSRPARTSTSRWGTTGAPVFALQRFVRDHRYLIAVLKDSATRGGSKAMHERAGRRRTRDQRATESLSAGATRLAAASCSRRHRRRRSSAWPNGWRRRAPISSCTIAPARRSAPRSANGSPMAGSGSRPPSSSTKALRQSRSARPGGLRRAPEARAPTCMSAGRRASWTPY